MTNVLSFAFVVVLRHIHHLLKSDFYHLIRKNKW